MERATAACVVTLLALAPAAAHAQGWGLVAEALPAAAALAALATAIATIYFVRILKNQLKIQQEGHRLTMRPVVVVDKLREDPGKPHIRMTGSGGLQIRLVNMGGVHAARTRIMTLPLDGHDGYVEREKALKDYLRSIGPGEIRSSDLAIVMHPARERMKRSSRHGSFENYLLVGSDLKAVRPASDRLDAVLDTFDDRKAFDEAGRARLASLDVLGDDDWQKFYHAGPKRGDMLDRTGPVDWENFEDGSMGKEEIRDALGAEADDIYSEAPDRKRIVESMDPGERTQFHAAIQQRQEIWNRQSLEVTRSFAAASMKLRRVYRDSRDVGAKMLNTMAQGYPVDVEIPPDHRGSGPGGRVGYSYFGVIVQYGRPGGDPMEYTYYLQGYVRRGEPHIDYVLDRLD